METTAAPVLPYADGVTQYGVAVVRQPDVIRVTVPPVRRLSDIGAGYFVGGALLLFQLTVPALSMWGDPEFWTFFAFHGSFYGSCLGLLLLGIAYRLKRRIIFEVDQKYFTLVYAGMFGDRRATWPIADIHEARLNTFNGKLLLRITGQDTLEIFLTLRREANELVATTLAAAIAHPPTADRAEEGFAKSSPARPRALVWPAIFFCVLAVGSIAIAFFIPGAACFIGLLAIVPLGIALGTQNKEYYM